MAIDLGKLMKRLRKSFRWNTLGRDEARTRKRSARPMLEMLECRCVPANFGTVQGVVFLDVNHNGILDAADLKLPGAARSRSSL